MSHDARVLLVGWDAADWRVIRPLVAAGKMPCLGRLIERGLTGNLLAGGPLDSTAIWMSMTTGRNATEHAVSGAMEMRPDRAGLRPITRGACRAETVWEILARCGVPCHAINFPVSHPPREIGGVCVSNAFVSEGIPESIGPEKYRQEMLRLRMKREEIDKGLLKTFVPGIGGIDSAKDGRPGAVAEILAETATVHNAATWAMEHVPWRMAAVCYAGIHQASHAFMAFYPPWREGVDESDFEMYRHVVSGMYQLHDMMLGRLCELAGEEAVVMLVSDHGFHCDHLRPPAEARTDEEMVVWHRRQGIVAVGGPRVGHGKISGNVLDVTPTVLRLFGMRIAGMEGNAWQAVAGDQAGELISAGEINEIAGEKAADVKYLLDLGYVEEPDHYADAAERRLDWRRRYLLAEACMDRGQAAAAIVLLEELVREDGDRLQYQIGLAHAYAAGGRMDDGRRMVDRLREAYPESAEALAAAGMLELIGRRAARAIELFHQAEEMGARSSALYVDLGRAYLKLRLFGDAARALEKGIELDQESAEAWGALSAARLGGGEVNAAIKAAEQAVALRPDQAEFHYRLGKALLASIGQQRAGCGAIERAVMIDPDFIAGWRLLSEIAERAGEIAAAREWDRQAHLAAIRQRWSRLTKDGTARANPA